MEVSIETSMDRFIGLSTEKLFIKNVQIGCVIGGLSNILVVNEAAFY